jgi:addiction module HigA family antidote
MLNKMSLADYLSWLDQNRELFPTPRRERKPPKHPGKILREEFLDKLGITQSELAQKLNCRFAKINEILNEKRSITPRFAIQLEATLGIPAEAWISMQGEFDLWKARLKGSRPSRTSADKVDRKGGS